jgi:hypothetical protein
MPVRIHSLVLITPPASLAPVSSTSSLSSPLTHAPPPLSSPPSRSGPLLPWSDNDVGEMGVVAWGEMEAATRGETGVAAHHRRCFSSSPSVPSSLPPPIEQPQVPLSSRHTSTRQASRTVGGGEDTPICGSRGASVDDAHAHPTPAGGRNSDFSM